MTKEELLQGESENVEFKVQRPADSSKYLKTVVAFANGKGGAAGSGGKTVEDRSETVETNAETAGADAETVEPGTETVNLDHAGVDDVNGVNKAGVIDVDDPNHEPDEPDREPNEPNDRSQKWVTRRVAIVQENGRCCDGRTELKADYRPAE